MEPKPAPENNDIAIADYRWKYIIYAAICWSLVLAGYFGIAASNRNWQFWMAEVVMLLFALGLTYMLLNPRYRFLGRKGPEYDEWLQQKYQSLLGENGMFEYNDAGFVFHAPDAEVNVLWSQITRISAHLEDLVSNDDDICLRIEYADGHFLEIDEEIPGWLRFTNTIQKQFNCSKDWQTALSATNVREIVLFPG